MWETLYLLSPSLPGLRCQRQQGTTPSPVPSAHLPGGRLPRVNRKEKSHLYSGNVDLPPCPLGSALCNGFPRDPASLSQASTSMLVNTRPGPNQKPSLLQCPSFHSSTAGTFGRCRKAHGKQGHHHTMRGGFSKVCFIEIRGKKEQFLPSIKPGSYFKAQFTPFLQEAFPDCPNPQSLPFLHYFCNDSQLPP